MGKIRIDDYLIENKYLENKDIVKRYVMAGKVFINNIKISSSALMYKKEDIQEILIKESKKYSSRGAYKLKRAIEYWKIDMKDKVMLDVGSSTGGFVSLALDYNAALVYALDVGTNQLDYKLRIHPQVKVYEQTNFRLIDDKFFDVKFDIITMDVSFISVVLLLDNVKVYLKENGIFICLIKPQFEADREVKREKGIIVDPKVYEDVIKKVEEECLKRGLKVDEIIDSPITGTKGNREFLAYIKHNDKD